MLYQTLQAEFIEKLVNLSSFEWETHERTRRNLKAVINNYYMYAIFSKTEYSISTTFPRNTFPLKFRMK